VFLLTTLASKLFVVHNKEVVRSRITAVTGADKPVLIARDRTPDFGGGFYVTPKSNQALPFPRRVADGRKEEKRQ
jgi:hypothetical protein